MLKQAYAILRKHAQAELQNLSSEIEQEWCELKLVHSQDVLLQGRKLIDAEPTLRNAEHLEYLECALLLHDIGRFYDEIIKTGDCSFPHGEYAAQLLLEEPDPRLHHPLLLLPIKYHNLIDLQGFTAEPSYLALSTEEQQLAIAFAKLLRDADKLSNLLRIIHDTMFLIPKYTDQPEASPAVWEAFMQGQSIKNPLCNTKIDAVLRTLGWIYDLNFASTAQILLDNQMMNAFSKHLHEFGATEELIAQVTEVVNHNLQMFIDRMNTH